jgi:amino acid transporter
MFRSLDKEKKFQTKIDTKCDNVVLGSATVGSDNDDDVTLIKMGYKPQLRREFNYLSAFGQAWGSQGLAPSIAGSLIFALGSGGSVTSIWTWIVGCVILIPVALALGEMGSSMPTSGGIYYWVAKLTPIKYRPLLCWFSAYMIILGYVTCYASTVYLTTTMFLATISMSTDGSYVPNKYHDYGVYVGFCIITCAMTSFSSRILAKLNVFYVVYQGCLCLALILAMAIATPSEYRNSAKFVFLGFQNTGHWTNNGWAWCLGLLTPVWVVSGFESSSTLAEEASNASRVVPFAMISSLLASLFVGTGIIITLMFTMGTDIVALLASRFEQPVGQMLYNGLGRNGAVTLFFFLFLGFVFNCTNLAFAASREMFAFSRDGGFPFSTHLQVLSKWKVPVRCVVACGFISVIIGLLMLANFTAISAVFNIAIIAMYCGYIAPIVSRLVWRDLTPGVFYLGRFSIINSIIAVLWMVFIIVLLLFPTYQTPDATEMNYAIVVVGFVVIFCLTYYYCPKYGGKTFFNGPVRTVDLKQQISNEIFFTRL